MKTQQEKKSDKKTSVFDASNFNQPKSEVGTFQFMDNRPEVFLQRKLNEAANRKHVVQKVGDYSGVGSDGPHRQSWSDWTKEKVHGAAITAADYVRGHPAGLASTGVEIATHSVDVLALRTVFNELKTALNGLGDDLTHADIWSIVIRCVDASAAAVRGGASVAIITHGWGEATGIPLVGDVAWYGSGAARDKIKEKIRPYMLKAISHKKKIGKQD